MGCMSASDAAPLPRLGEVFFDVRGESRSMRLSWYADTAVAVFSIWQGGTCTGTFRLPIADLPRMVEALKRGPRGVPGPRAEGEHAPPPGTARGERPLTPSPGDGWDYQEDPLASGRSRHGQYRAIPPGTGYPDEPTGVYRGGELTGGYQMPPGAEYRDDPLTGGPGGFGEGPSGGYGDGPPSGYREEPPAGYGEELPAGYHEAPPGGYGEDPADGYSAGPPPGADYLYPGESPARPYVTDSGGEPDVPADGGGSGGRRSRGGRPRGPTPESFPYGVPPDERPSPPRRYPDDM